MTAVRSDLFQRAAVTVLDDRDVDEFLRLLDADPFVTAAVGARVREVGSLDHDRLGGYAVGIRSDDGLVAACFAGGNAVPIAGDPASIRRLADYLAGQPRISSSVVGRADVMQALWPRLASGWGTPRAIRHAQPLLVLDGPIPVAGDESVQVALPCHLDRYVGAATAMFTDEIGVSPHVAPGTAAFHARLRQLVARGRAFASFDFRGQVIFKAEIGAVTPHTAQIQGVWVRPDLRRRGIGTAALATVFEHALDMAPTVSLYVNGFNRAALRMYERLGMREHALLSTVLID
ncbi:MAG TPA: GNAT family N-acetyltransferase [Jatrophihabitantaceae bacterium]|nr:GNAT family N-acetyltransferase [Jatrophihabitantaceae bacterium]